MVGIERLAELTPADLVARVGATPRWCWGHDRPSQDESARALGRGLVLTTHFSGADEADEGRLPQKVGWPWEVWHGEDGVGMIHRGRCVAACLVGASLPAGGAFGSDRREDAAQSAAESWLKLVDGGGYAESWSQASVPVKESVKQADWAQSVGGVRGLLGKVVSHRLKSRAYSEKAGAARVIGGRVYRACRGTSFAEFHGRVIVLPDA